MLERRKMDTRNEIKSYINQEGFTMAELVGKPRRDFLRYRETVELADALGYDIVWQRRKEVR